MCCYNDQKEIKSLKAGPTIITFYKKLRKIKARNGYPAKLESIYLYHPCKWKPGTVKSNAGVVEIPSKKQRIFEGIHVYRNRPFYKNENQRIVQVVCDIDDLIGASSRDAVFTKVVLTEKEYRKFVKF